MVLHDWIFLFSILCCRLDLASGQADSLQSRAPSIRTVPSETLSDLAVAFADPLDPVIYYNPRLMKRYGPEMTAFVLAHEYAHIELGHRRPAAVTREALELLLQGWELDADCLAAVRLSRERPGALHAATSFFHAMGSDRVDREHPTGSARAVRLTACGRTQNGDPSPLGKGPRSTTAKTAFK